MTEVLTQKEIDELLSAITDGYAKPEEYKPAMYSRKIKIYDFKRPEKFSREQIRIISIIHETFSRLIKNSLSVQLRSMAHVHVASVDQLTYDEFIRSINTPTTLAVINMNPLNGYAIMEIDPVVTFAIIDRICGGIEDGTKSRHELTDIEKSIMENIIIRMLGNLREAWTTVLDLCPRLEAIETTPQFVQIVPPTEMVVLVTIEIKIGIAEGMINFCFPYLTVEPIIEKLSSRFWYGKNQNNIPIISSSNLKFRENIPVRLTAEILNRDYPVREIWKWNTETLILPLRPLSPDYCYLWLGDRRVWQCQILPDCKWFPKRIKIVNYAEKPFGTEGNDMKMKEGNSPAADALSCAMMKISVELGTTLKTVKEVFAMNEGTILELDKLAGEQVDVKANGVLIAFGEVVVIDENFGVRITKIAGTSDIPDHRESPAPEPPEPTVGETTTEQNTDSIDELSKELLKAAT